MYDSATRPPRHLIGGAVYWVFEVHMYTVAQIWGKTAPLKLCKELTTKEKYFKTYIFSNIGLIEFSVLSIISKP